MFLNLLPYVLWRYHLFSSILSCTLPFLVALFTTLQTLHYFFHCLLPPYFLDTTLHYPACQGLKSIFCLLLLLLLPFLPYSCSPWPSGQTACTPSIFFLLFLPIQILFWRVLTRCWAFCSGGHCTPLRILCSILRGARLVVCEEYMCLQVLLTNVLQLTIYQLLMSAGVQIFTQPGSYCPTNTALILGLHYHFTEKIPILIVSLGVRRCSSVCTNHNGLAAQSW